eukprot:363881-Chlamydomonas_euryale.AAC.5
MEGDKPLAVGRACCEQPWRGAPWNSRPRNQGRVTGSGSANSTPTSAQVCHHAFRHSTCPFYISFAGLQLSFQISAVSIGRSRRHGFHREPGISHHWDGTCGRFVGPLRHQVLPTIPERPGDGSPTGGAELFILDGLPDGRGPPAGGPRPASRTRDPLRDGRRKRDPSATPPRTDGTPPKGIMFGITFVHCPAKRPAT